MEHKNRVIDNHPINEQEHIASNIAAVRASIKEAAERVGRRSQEITLIAVSKTMPVTLVEMASHAGITDFGENRVQEALPKISVLRSQGLRWHMIGRLQTNKARKVASSFDTVHSIDSLHLAQALNRFTEVAQKKRLPVLLEVNVAAEQSKAGITPAEVPALARQIAQLPYLELQGLMTVAPRVDNPEDVRSVFRALRLLRDHLRDEVPDCTWQHLSMGMTDDYCIAIEEGATIVRVGRAIFGERVYKGDHE
jgi:PLP dependent protein